MKTLRFCLVKKQKHFIGYYLLWAPYILVYQATNRFQLFTPRTLEITWLDRAIPFVSFLIPVYVSYLVYAFVVLARSRDDRELNELFYMTHFQLVVCAAFFVFFPVTFPREDFYAGGPVSQAFLGFWTWFDAPNNCFPSLHTANCALAAHYSLGKPHQWVFAAWGALIICSTVLCKQHYVVDVAAGLAVYLASLLLRNLLLRPWQRRAGDC